MDSPRNVARCKAPDGMTSRLPLKLLATPGGRGLGSGARLSGPVLCIPT